MKSTSNPRLIGIAAVLLTLGPLIAGIQWDTAHPVLIKEGAHYGRIARIDKDTLIAGYDFRRAIHVSLSHDEGKTWDAPIKIASNPEGALTNTELLVLKNGEVLCFFNFRPNRDAKPPYSIGMSRTRDGAKTWSPPETFYSAAKDFGDGCWEPSAVQIPDGEVQVYFANESPYRDSNEQEISMLRSRDNGHTWGMVETISFRKNHRDGMPVPVVSADAGMIFVAIEDNGLSGNFKPVIVSTRLERGGWREGAVTGESPNRRGALAKPLPAATYAGAPYLRQFHKGPFVLSFQMAESGNLKHSRMAVSLGNDAAGDFGEPTFPFPDTSGGAQLWNALFIKDGRTVTAVSETTLNGVRGIWAVDGLRQP